MVKKKPFGFIGAVMEMFTSSSFFDSEPNKKITKKQKRRK